MADREFSSLTPLLAPSVPGCPNATMIQYIRDAAIRTCERTLAWRYQIPAFSLTPGVPEYFYNKPANTAVHAVFETVINGTTILERLTLEQAVERYPKWAELFSGIDPAVAWGSTPPISTFNTPVYNEVLFNDGTPYEVNPDALVDAATPRVITQVSPDKFIILPLPDDEEVYRCLMFVALKPKRSATGMDEVMFDELEEVIMHGALQHLLVLPNTNWSDRELASYHAKQYSFQVAERRARANLGNARGSMRVKMQPFGV